MMYINAIFDICICIKEDNGKLLVYGWDKRKIKKKMNIFASTISPIFQAEYHKPRNYGLCMYLREYGFR